MAMTTEDTGYRQIVEKFHKRKQQEQLRHERYTAQSSAAAAGASVVNSFLRTNLTVILLSVSHPRSRHQTSLSMHLRNVSLVS